MEAASANKRGEIVIPTPVWFIALRVLQIVVSLVAVGLTGWWIHGLYYDELGFVIVCGVFTWIIAVYAILAEKVRPCRPAYNTWAILALDLLMVIFWLAAMGATANRRSKFTIPVTASCASDGSLINSGYCTIWKRAGVASQGALSILSGIAGICAIIMLLFVATFAYVCHFFRLSFANFSNDDPEKASAAGTVPSVNPGGIVGTELQAGMKPQNLASHQESGEQWAQQTAYPHQVDQSQYQQGQAYIPHAPQNTEYTSPPSMYPQQGSQAEQLHNPHNTPAPGQPHSPQSPPAPGHPY